MNRNITKRVSSGWSNIYDTKKTKLQNEEKHLLSSPYIYTKVHDFAKLCKEITMQHTDVPKLGEI